MTSSQPQPQPHPTRRHVRVALLAGLALAAASAVVVWRAQQPPEPPAAPPVADGRFTFHWPAGQRLLYDLTLETTGRVLLGTGATGAGQAPLDARLMLHGQLALRSHGRTSGADGAYVLAVELASLDRLEWTMAGQPVVPGPQMLLGRSLIFVVDPRGRVLEHRQSPGELAQAVNLLRLAMGALQVVIGDGERWTASEHNLLGTVEATYAVLQDTPELLTLSRRPTTYTRMASGRLHGQARLEVGGEFTASLARATPGGHLRTLEGRERVSALSPDGGSGLSQNLTVKATLVAVEPGSAPEAPADALLARLERHGPEEVTVSADLQTRLLTQRADGLTREQLLADLAVHGRSPKFPDLPRWLWRASGLLALHPELCRELVARFTSPEANADARARITELLAATDHPEAQVALRAVLDTPEARADGQLGRLVQRFGQVAHPDGRSVAWLAERVDAWSGDDRLAAAHALGATLRRTADEPAREAGAAQLQAMLQAAATPAEVAAGIGALGNAGLPQQVELVAGYATHPEARVRNAVARALRHTQTPAAEPVLLALVTDPSESVQLRALESLAGWKLEPRHLETLRSLVDEGRIDRNAHEMLVTVLHRHRDLPPEALRPVLQALLASAVEGRVKVRARALLQELERRPREPAAN
ncbi:MAG: HEAT repeat domain-containing protein [Myxococcota bacterium]|nr:HEAT repeat domain-containing protein [Myxococcota bacterium]